METLGQRIKSLRGYVKLDQEAFSQKIDCSKGYLAKLENNIATPSEIFLRNISFTFGINYRWLVYGEGSLLQEYPTAESVYNTLFNSTLDESDMRFLHLYSKLSSEERKNIRDYYTKHYL